MKPRAEIILFHAPFALNVIHEGMDWN